MALVEDGNIVENDKNTASVLNEFFSNIITTLGFPRYNEKESVCHNIGDPLMKVIIKYRFHPSVIAIKENCNSGFCFSFSQVECEEIMKEINNLRANKATRSTDIPTKLIKENSDIFKDSIFGNCNNCVSYSIFSKSWTRTGLELDNWTRTHNHLVYKRTLNHLAKLAR